jgi:hypothetical protein
VSLSLPLPLPLPLPTPTPLALPYLSPDFLSLVEDVAAVPFSIVFLLLLPSARDTFAVTFARARA